MTDKKVRPAEVFPPAEYLRDELQARGWTGYDLAARLGWSMVKAGDLLAGRMQITGELADKLGDVFGTSSELWLNLQQTYLRWAP